MWRKLAMAVLLPVVALTLAPAAAQAAPEEVRAAVCSSPEVFGSYAIRACIRNQGQGVQPYAVVSLQAGHSACEVRVRWVRSDGAPGPLSAENCPAGAITSWVVMHPAAVGPGTFRAAVSIRRISDGNIAPKAVSPYLST